MEIFETFIGIIAFVWGILCIILFFKVWGMCNDVNQIKKHLLGIKTVDFVDSGDGENPKFALNQVLVVKQDESEFMVSHILREKGVVKYFDPKRQKYFAESEVEDYNEYWKYKRQQ